MPITESDIEKIAKLAHLEITDEERRALTPQIASIVAYVEQLNELDTSQVEPATGGLTPEGERTEAARDDVILPSLGQQLALEEAPDPSHGHFRVPKVLS
ncbi:MAG TPA: Asp-tRNA(Asn)/Glu-tRNA(Gln) amidotransferase subunit GatC [Pyrinomonadaceae bacterium]|nr:Asp-tRNA(Asn)/Glu-tRNA(Gln) amidotransferase subunit GatC [Pyrinomonadaceae bacterium]